MAPRIGLFIALFLPQLSNAQIQIHSISNIRSMGADYGYTLDGSWMEGSSRLKLLNSVNFGLTGIYPEGITIYDGYGVSGSLESVASLDTNAIFFFGAFNSLAPYHQYFLDAELDSLYAWTMQGGRVLIAAHPNTVGFDFEYLYSKWEYEALEDYEGSFHPTQAGINTDIFNGPFGIVPFADFGGTLRGYFSEMPDDVSILATDIFDRPTMVMDCKTLDVLLTDIDAFTTLGGISNGNEVVNQQDRFWANTISFLHEIQVPPVISISDSNLLVLNDEYVQYQWFLDDIPISSNNIQPADKSGEYYVEVTLNGGCKRQSNRILVEQSEEFPLAFVDFPNAFSPNSDDLNDYFEPVILTNARDLYLQIYNRHGIMVYDDVDGSLSWNGKKLGNDCPEGTYFWTVSYVDSEGQRIYRNGSFFLFR